MAIDLALPFVVFAFAMQEPSASAPAGANPSREDAPAGYCPPPCETVAEEEPGPWEISAALGLALSAGNAETLTLDWDLFLDYRTSAWEWTLETEGLLVKAVIPGSGGDDLTELVLIYSLDTRLEKRFTPLLGVYGLVGGMVDHAAAIELRLDTEAGVAFTVVDRKGNAVQDWLLRVDLGLHYSNESRREYYAGRRDLEDVSLLSPGLGFTLKVPVAENAKFHQSAHLLPALDGSSRARFGSKSKFATYVTKHLALDANLMVDLDTDRAVGKEDTDVVLTFGVEYDL